MGARSRASTVTYLQQQGFPDNDIMRVTGHSTSEMVHACDKSSRAENASKKSEPYIVDQAANMQMSFYGRFKSPIWEAAASRL